jgi:hypothetical protein
VYSKEPRRSMIYQMNTNEGKREKIEIGMALFYTLQKKRRFVCDERGFFE